MNNCCGNYISDNVAVKNINGVCYRDLTTDERNAQSTQNTIAAISGLAAGFGGIAYTLYQTKDWGWRILGSMVSMTAAGLLAGMFFNTDTIKETNCS